MKILYLNLDRGIPVLGDKGASVHVRAFVAAASTLGHETALVCPVLGEGNRPPPARLVHVGYETGGTEPSGPSSTPAARDAPRDDHIVRRERARLAYDQGVPARVFAALEAAEFRPDVVYERHALFHRAGVDIARRLGVPRLLEVNAPLIEEQRKYRGLCMEAEARSAEAESYRGADAIVAVSEAVRNHVTGVLGDAATVHVVPNGVDLARFRVAGPAHGALRRRLGLGSAPTLGFIGSFKPWHGVGFLLEVFASLSAAWPELRLIAVGDGPERDTVAARARHLGLADRVVLPGRVPHDEVPAWLEAMDVTVAPYTPQEDFYFSPLKIIESLAAGRPVVAPRIGQIATLIDDNRTGLLYVPGDPNDCQAALGALIGDPARLAKMAAEAHRSADGSSWVEVVRRTLALAPGRGRHAVAA